MCQKRHETWRFICLRQSGTLIKNRVTGWQTCRLTNRPSDNKFIIVKCHSNIRTYQKKDRYTNRPKNRLSVNNKKRKLLTSRRTDIQMNRNSDKQTGILTFIHTSIKKYQYTYLQKYRQTDRQSNEQAGKHLNHIYHKNWKKNKTSKLEKKSQRALHESFIIILRVVIKNVLPAFYMYAHMK